ncbi:MAG: tRNA (adenosine(37)-N6)-threonylcarbamoyltransferase complex dimerization subunit type 1 TsaB [Bacteroidales bacterium]|nr:tRNA (adenosine(37)-N6)-threonylcarbamoyltransferase complex dimerization subunit type 1 TsaB [Bacteroidales bacterium]
MLLLLLETATPVCSVALACNGKILAERHSAESNAHSSKLALFIDQLMNECKVSPHQLDAVCVSSGPGSYTGLRIGVSSAKGFCYALSVPLLSVPTLQGMAAQYFAQHPDYQGLVCPMIDARRMECYTAIYSRDGEVKPVSADIIEAGIYDTYLNQGQVVFCGDGAAKTQSLLGVHPNAVYAPEFEISAAGLLPVALDKLARNQVEDVAYFEPYYLKDFVAKKSVVRGLRN